MSLDMVVESGRMVGVEWQGTVWMDAGPEYSAVLQEAGDAAPPSSQLFQFARDHHFIVHPDRVPDLLHELRALDVSSERLPHTPAYGVEYIRREHRAVIAFVESALDRRDYLFISAAPGAL